MTKSCIEERGPIYGVELISTLKLNGSMMQAMPSAGDLRRVQGLSMRTVAGYEALLSKYHTLMDTVRMIHAIDCLDQTVKEKLLGIITACEDVP